MRIIVKTMHGLEPMLAKELKQQGATEILELRRAVMCTGSKEVLYRINLHSRYAIRALVQKEEFNARDEEQLYKKIKAIDWSRYLTIDSTFAIDATVNSEIFTHSHYLSLKCKDAIVDQFREKTGKRPSIELDDPDLRINVHCRRDRFTVSIDSSGQSLNRRGYRVGVHEAPINEVLAAGIIGLSGWDMTTDLIDPMCGSGTIAIEAAMMAKNIPPAHLREHFGFMSWDDYDAELWREIKEDSKVGIRPSEVRIYGQDLSSKYASQGRESASLIGVDDCTEFREMNFFDSSAENATIVCNPPYGERLGSEDRIGKMTVPEFYKNMGDRFKQHYGGCTVTVISSNFGALKKFGLRPSKKTIVYNGALECKLLTYEMYAGSKKAKWQSENEEK